MNVTSEALGIFCIISFGCVLGTGMIRAVLRGHTYARVQFLCPPHSQDGMELESGPVSLAGCMHCLSFRCASCKPVQPMDSSFLLLVKALT